MTEQEWLECKDPRKLLNQVKLGNVLPYISNSDRRLRLLACACCRCVWDKLSECACVIVATAERYADGEASIQELKVAANPERYNQRYPDPYAFMPWWLDSLDEFFSNVWIPSRNWPDGVLAKHADLIREIVGNPFQPIISDCNMDRFYCDSHRCYLTRTLSDTMMCPAGRGYFDMIVRQDPTVKALSQTIYKERTFKDLPVLADALENLGVTAPLILNHLRDTSIDHVRGCWALDLILGKVMGNIWTNRKVVT